MKPRPSAPPEPVLTSCCCIVTVGWAVVGSCCVQTALLKNWPITAAHATSAASASRARRGRCRWRTARWRIAPSRAAMPRAPRARGGRGSTLELAASFWQWRNIGAIKVVHYICVACSEHHCILNLLLRSRVCSPRLEAVAQPSGDPRARCMHPVHVQSRAPRCSGAGNTPSMTPLLAAIERAFWAPKFVVAVFLREPRLYMTAMLYPSRGLVLLRLVMSPC